MTKRMMIRVIAWVVLSGGMLLLVATADVALSLGTGEPFLPANSSDGFTLVFLHHLATIRMLAVAMLGLSAICFWSVRTLTETQGASLLKVLSGVFALTAGMAFAQQVAIWGREAGWAIVGTLGILSIACLVGALSGGQRQKRRDLPQPQTHKMAESQGNRA